MSSEDLVAMLERLVRIETKIDLSNRTHDDHEARIRKLERTVWIATGFAAALGGVAGQLASKLLGG